MDGDTLAELPVSAPAKLLRVAEQKREGLGMLRGRGRRLKAVLGDAVEPYALVQAHIAKAISVIAIPDDFDSRKVAGIARVLSRQIEIVIRTRSKGAVASMQRDKAGTVSVGEKRQALS